MASAPLPAGKSLTGALKSGQPATPSHRRSAWRTVLSVASVAGPGQISCCGITATVRVREHFWTFPVELVPRTNSVRKICISIAFPRCKRLDQRPLQGQAPSRFCQDLLMHLTARGNAFYISPHQRSHPSRSDCPEALWELTNERSGRFVGKPGVIRQGCREWVAFMR